MPDTIRPLNERLIGTLWVCESCYLVHANGECGELPDDYPEPLCEVADYELSAGMSDIEHDDRYCLTGYIAHARQEWPDLDWPDVPGDYECECETIEFATFRCEGCGDTHHGKREAITAWERA